MHLIRTSFLAISMIGAISSQAQSPFLPDFSLPEEIPGFSLVWHDEFNNFGKPDTSVWVFEKGFVRNEELQWYQQENAHCEEGMLIIEGRREERPNPNYEPDSHVWRRSRPMVQYTSSSLQTRGNQQWQYGRFEVRARIDTAMGSWPAIWTLGVEQEWPQNGEIDLMEFYRVDDNPTILANVAWGTEQRWVAEWDSEKIPFSKFLEKDPRWTEKFHVWRMDWDEDSIKIYLDDEILNSTSLDHTLNPDGSNPFKQPHYLLLNLAIGANGGDPSNTVFPVTYEVDYVRVYQKSGR